MSNTPVLLTALGVEVVSAAHITYIAGTRVPKAVKVRKEATYTIEVPDLWTKLGRLERAPIDLHALVSTRVADPVYLEVMAPFRYGLYLERYIQHLPNRTILRLWARTNRGEEQSQELYLERR